MTKDCSITILAKSLQLLTYSFSLTLAYTQHMADATDDNGLLTHRRRMKNGAMFTYT